MVCSTGDRLTVKTNQVMPMLKLPDLSPAFSEGLAGILRDKLVRDRAQSLI